MACSGVVTVQTLWKFQGIKSFNSYKSLYDKSWNLWIWVPTVISHYIISHGFYGFGVRSETIWALDDLLKADSLTDMVDLSLGLDYDQRLWKYPVWWILIIDGLP